MKTLFFATFVITSALNAFAQGTVTLNNRVAGLGTTHVYGPGDGFRTGNGSADVPTGPTDYRGFILIGTVGGMIASTTYATLIGAPGSNAPESAMLASITSPTTFRTGAAAGNVAAKTDTFANILPDAPVATFEMVAWDNTSGLYPTWTEASVAFANGLIIAGHSMPFVLQAIGGNVNTPPNIVGPGGMQSFSLSIPEPTTISIAGVGAAALLSFRRRNQELQPRMNTDKHG
jgi:hypothetical protein